MAEMTEMRSWTVEQVCEFVATIDICAEYAKVRRRRTWRGEYAKGLVVFLFSTSKQERDPCLIITGQGVLKIH